MSFFSRVVTVFFLLLMGLRWAEKSKRHLKGFVEIEYPFFVPQKDDVQKKPSSTVTRSNHM